MAHEHEEHSCCGNHEHKEKAAETSPKSLPTVKGAVTSVFRIAGMDCSEEVEAIEKAVKPISGVEGVQSNIIASKTTVVHQASVSEETLLKAICSAGVTAESDKNKASAEANGASFPLEKILVSVSGLLTGFGLLLQWLDPSPKWVSDSCFIGAVLAGGWLVFPDAFRALRKFSLDMKVLMTVAVLGAFFIGQHAEAAAVVFLFSLSELLESWSVGRARRAIQSLLEITPPTAWVKRGDKIVEVPVGEIALDEIVKVKSGQSIPVDGEVVSGKSSVNQAPITGESMPVDKEEGGSVFAGTINGEGSLEIKVTKLAADSTLARIIKRVEEAQQDKAPTQRFVDKFARYYTPAVMFVALILGLVPPLLFSGSWDVWTYRALVLLVIACPCALVISTPVSVVSGLTALARRGVLVKGGAYLEALGKLKALAVDKTGTITEGKPSVLEVIPWGSSNKEEVVRIAAAIDSNSEHPLAKAVVEFAKSTKAEFPHATDYQAKTGRGAEAKVDGHLYFVGNHRFVHELGVCSDDLEKKLSEIESSARSVVVVGHAPHDGCKGEVLGILAVGDSVRPEAKKAVQSLLDVGLTRIVMLSGDNQRTATAIAAEAGIKEAHGDLLPDDKITWIKKLHEETGSVGMIGDGVNDAPALALADVGIAMGAAGTDTAIETADVALMRDDLSAVSEAVLLGRRTLSIIRFNIIFALAIKAVFLVLAVLGMTSLWLAILADTGATLLVIANALRLLKK